MKDILAQLSPLYVDFVRTDAFLTFPVYDGFVVPADPMKAIRDGRFNKVRLLLGYNADEGSIFIPEGTDELQYKMMATRLFGYGRGEFVRRRFPADAGNSALQRTREIFAYGMFTTGMKVFADAYADSGEDVYAYRFNYVSEEAAKRGLGANHAAELPYVFANPRGGEDAKLISEMHLRWANFIRNGDPNVGEKPPTQIEWPKYDSESSNMLIFDKTLTTAPMPGKSDMEFMQDVMYGDKPYYEPEGEEEAPEARGSSGGCLTGAAFLSVFPALFAFFKS